MDEENGENASGGGRIQEPNGGGRTDVDSFGELFVLSTQGLSGDGGLTRPLTKL